jgi:hypothetical protein
MFVVDFNLRGNGLACQEHKNIDALRAVPSPLPGVYTFSRNTTLRNLYRIPIP